MPTPLEELPDIQLDDEEEEAGDVRWRPLWQQSLERMSTSSSKPSLSSSSASSPSGGPGRKPLGAKDAYIRTPGGGRMRLDAAAQHHQPPPPRASSSSVARGAVSSSSPPLKSQQHKPSAHLSANRAGSRMGPAPLLPSRGGRGAPPSGGDGGPHRGAGGRGASAGGARALPGPLRQAQQAKPHDDLLDEMAGLGDDAEVSKPQHPPVSWDRQKLIKEMVALPRSKKAYLLRMLEDMEKELQTEAAAAAGGGGALHHHEGGGEESRHGGMEGRDPASASPSRTESGEEGGGGLGLLREKVGWSKEAGGAYPAEVLKIWARVQKLRPHPHHPTHHHHNKPRNNNNNSKPASSSSPPRPQQEAAKAHQARPQMVGPSVLRDRLVADFDVRLAPREVTVLMKHFATTNNNHPTNKSEVDYREVASFLRQTRISSSSNTHHAAAAPGTSSSSTGSGGPIDSSSGSRGSQPPARRRPLHQEEAARSVLSVPPDEASRALLEKIAAVAARTNRQELGAVFRADESRRSVLVPPQEFKALLWTGLQLRLAPQEFDLLLQWFGNGLHDKSAAIDLALFSQQFWALGSAAKTRRRKEEAQDRFIRALSTKPRHRPPPTTTSSTSPAVANQQDEQHGGGGGGPPSPPSGASPVASPSGSDCCYDDDDFEDERSVNSHHHNNASSSHHSAHTGLSTRHPW